MIRFPGSGLPDSSLTPAALAKRKRKEQLALDGQNFYRNLGLSPTDPTNINRNDTITIRTSLGTKIKRI